MEEGTHGVDGLTIDTPEKLRTVPVLENQSEDAALVITVVPCGNNT